MKRLRFAICFMGATTLGASITANAQIEALLKGSKLQTYSSDSAMHVRECDRVAKMSFPDGGHICLPKGTLISSGKRPDGADATHSWRCACS